jgi:precorrin isomerase
LTGSKTNNQSVDMANAFKTVKKTGKTWSFKKKAAKKIEKEGKVLIVGKSPASILYELMMKNGKWPVYEILVEKPSVPLFSYRVSCGRSAGELS